jgi:CRP-like cAMP-binding protein
VYLFDGAKTAIESQTTAADIRRRIVDAPLLNEIGDDVLDQLAAAASVGQFERGETIIVEGEQHDLFLLHEGRAHLVLRRDDSEDLGVLDIEAGEVFGVLDEPPGTDRAALVVAVTDCDVVKIPPEAARRALMLAPDLAAVLEQLAVTRRRRIERVLRRSDREGADPAQSTAVDTMMQDDQS